MTAIARMFLVLSSTLGIVIGMAFVGASVFGFLNTNLLSNYIKLDVRSAPQPVILKRKIDKSLQETGIVQTAARILLMIGVHATCLSCLGILVSVADTRIYAKFYNIIDFVTILGFLAVMLLLTVAFSVIEKPIQDNIVDSLNKKLVSLVALYKHKSGDGTAETVILNYIQFTVECCGIRKVGDIRGSLRWRRSPRLLVDMLKLQPQLIGNSNIPKWLKKHLPTGAVLPGGVMLPTILPIGLVMSQRFQLTPKTLKSGKAVNRAFEDSLVLRTPMSCCRFKGKQSTSTLNARILVSRLVDPTCPFMALHNNSKALHNKTCHEKAINYMNKYLMFILIGGGSIGLYLICNLCLSIEILLHG